MTSYNGDYLGQMTNDLKNGMVFVVSNWEGDDSWLRKDKCGGSCFGDPVETISNIKITSGTSPIPPTPPGPYDPSDYEFGEACDHVDDGFCGDEGCTSVEHCKFSWKKGGSWTDPDAACRCDQTSPSPTPGPINPSDYTFGESCEHKDDAFCADMNCPSVDHCRFSWPNGSDWTSKDAACRCDIVTA